MNNVDSSNANRYLDEIVHVLEYLFFDPQATDQSFPKGNSWVGLAKTTISADFTAIDMFSHAYIASLLLHLKRPQHHHLPGNTKLRSLLRRLHLIFSKKKNRDSGITHGHITS